MPMPSNIFSKQKHKSTTTLNATITSGGSATNETSQLNTSTNSKKTGTKSKHTYQSINKNLNQLFQSRSTTKTTSFVGTSAFPSFSTSASPSVMMPSVASRIKKNMARTKEKILSSIGKTDRTSDENFDLYVENFDRQHIQASRLTKELNKYVNCLKETQKSSRLFYETLRDTYEPNWPGSNEFSEQIQLMEMKWNEYLSKLINEVQSPLIAYLNEFPELKKKIEKRGNRLLDYDNARHTLESAQQKSLKKQNNNTNTLNTGTATTSNAAAAAAASSNVSGGSLTGVASSSLTASGGSSSTSSSATDQLTKLTKLKIELEDKQQNYEELNQTLCMSLPVLYENRIKFYSSLFQTFFHTETIFHSDCVEVKSKLDDLCESLSTTTAQQTPNPQKLFQQKQEQLRLLQQQKELEELEENRKQSKNSTGDSLNSKNDNELPEEPPDESENSLAIIKYSNIDHHDDSLNSSGLKTSEYDNEISTTVKPSISEFVPDPDELGIHTAETFMINDKKNSINNQANEVLKSRDSSPKMSNSILKNRCLFKVKATYPYEAKELDELSFVKDDIIDVVDGSESEKEDLDEGWLIGVHETSLKRGLFPENFTRRI